MIPWKLSQCHKKILLFHDRNINLPLELLSGKIKGLNIITLNIRRVLETHFLKQFYVDTFSIEQDYFEGL